MSNDNTLAVTIPISMLLEWELRALALSAHLSDNGHTANACMAKLLAKSIAGIHREDKEQPND